MKLPNYGGLKIKEAREKIIEDFKKAGYLVKQEELEHEVQTHERCGKEVEYTIMKQWFIDIMNHKEDFIEIGNEIKWYPEHMHIDIMNGLKTLCGTGVYQDKDILVYHFLYGIVKIVVNQYLLIKKTYQ